MKALMKIPAAIILILFVGGYVDNIAQDSNDLLVQHGEIIDNFESGTLDKWEVVSGNLYQQPVMAWREGIPFQHEGKYFIGTTETGGSKRSDYNDSLTGVIKSKPFIIKNNFTSFLIGGGRDINNVYMSLIRVEDEYVIDKSTGKDSERMERRYWDVSDYLGVRCYLKIVDNSKVGFGHINVDDIRALDERSEKDHEATPLAIAGEYFRIYNPSIGENESWYINDHCFIMDKEGTWHLFGITHADPAKPWDEDNLAHATSKNLTEFPWEKHPFALSVVEDPWDEVHLWAPHVVYNDGKYYMFYCAGDKDPSKYKIHLATSDDLWTWQRHPENPVVRDGQYARDPFILKVDDKWVMYYTANSDPAGGNHIVAYRTSDDLVHWGERHTAYTDPKIGKGGGPTESPFVVQRGEYYYLLIGPRDGYVSTDMFVSKDPFHWDIKNKVGHFDSHAAEMIRDIDGKWYVSHCGWGKGGVYLAPLYWNDGTDNTDTSLPVPE